MKKVLGLCSRRLGHCRRREGRHGVRRRRDRQDLVIHPGKIQGKGPLWVEVGSGNFTGKTHRGTPRLKGDKIRTDNADLNGGRAECFGVSKSGNGYKTTNGATLTR